MIETQINRRILNNSLVGEIIHGVAKSEFLTPNDISEFRSSKNRNIVQYELDFDSYKYQSLARNILINEDYYKKQKEGLDKMIRYNLETALGERFNTGISRRVDIISNGVIKDINTGLELLPMFERGRIYRMNNGSSTHDREREQAEVDGFARIQEVLCDPDTPIGTIMVNISLSGGKESIYQHNFYDIFEKTDEGVEVVRYTSALTIEESVEKARKISSEHEFGKNITDISLLKSPIILDSASGFSSSEEVHAFFHKEHNFMKEKEYKEIISICVPYILNYIDIITNTPYDINGRNMAFNALLNKADLVADSLIRGKIDYVSDRGHFSINKEELYRLGMQEVRVVNAGCGSSRGAGVMGKLYLLNNPWSVFEAIMPSCGDCGSSSADSHYHCPCCNKEYSDETTMKQEDRTKSCGCGFAFGC